MPCLLSLALIMTCLAAAGAGVVHPALSGCALFAAIAAFCLSRFAPARRMIVSAALALGFLVLTIIPLPPCSDHIVGSERARQNRMARQTLADAQKLSLNIPQIRWFALTRNRAGSMRMVLLAVLILSGGALAAGAAPPRKKQILAVTLFIGSAVAIAGIAGAWIWPQGKTFWWLIPVSHGRPMGPFLNRNHCGGFAAMLCPAALAAAWNAFENRRFGAAAAFASSFGALVACAVLSLSRGAWLACGAGLAALALHQTLKRRAWPKAAATLAALAALVAALSLQSRAVVERAGTLRKGRNETTIAMRIQTWKDSASVFWDYPFLGVGPNAFRAVFPQYRAASTRPTFKHAENEYVQLPIEFGLAGSSLLVLFMVAGFLEWRPQSKSKECDPLFVSCAAGAIAAAAAHASCDFAIRIPLYAFTLAIICGLAWPSAAVRTFEQPGFKAPMAVLIAVALIIALHGRSIHENDESDHLMRSSAPALARALAWSPTSWQAWYHLGRRLLEEQPATAQALAHSCMTTAAAYDPQNYRLWAELCMLRMSLGDRAGAEEAFSKMKALRSWMTICNTD